jgi:hypothetical protein
MDRRPPSSPHATGLNGFSLRVQLEISCAVAFAPSALRQAIASSPRALLLQGKALESLQPIRPSSPLLRGACACLPSLSRPLSSQPAVLPDPLFTNFNNTLRCFVRGLIENFKNHDGVRSNRSVGVRKALLGNGMKPIMRRVKRLLGVGARPAHKKTRNTCHNIQELEKALRTYVRVEGVEQTNNNAERGQRRAVLWRRKSFGTEGESGSRFVERILTVVTSLRRQGRDGLEYLTRVCNGQRCC